MIEIPVFLYEPNNLYIFDSVEGAKRFAEPIDVINNEYKAYDAKGRLLRMTVQNHDKKQMIVLEPLEEVPTHQTELFNALKQFLASCRVDSEWLAQATLQGLIAKGLEYKTK